MTPQQRLGLSIRQSSDQAAAIIAWLERKGRRWRLADAGLREVLLNISSDLDTLGQALDGPPCIGFASAGGAGHASLVGRVLEAGERGRPGPDRQPLGEAARALISTEAGGGSGVTLRFAAREAPLQLDGFPFSARTLGIADLALIMVRVYSQCVPGALGSAPRLDRLAAIYDEVSPRLAAAVTPGLSTRDVHMLADALSSQFPEAESFRELAAAGFWRDLAEVAMHLPLEERIKVLAVLWGEHETITRLFAETVQALSRIGYAQDIFLPREALFAQTASSGWPSRHRLGVLSAETVLGLAGDGDEPVRIAGRHGHKASIARAALAALLAEVTIRTGQPPLSLTPDADLAAFPAPSPAPADSGAGGPNERAMREVLSAFTREKASYLLERAARRHELAALVLTLDPDSDADDGLAPAVAEWIDRTQGGTPAARELGATALFVVAAGRLADAGDPDRSGPEPDWGQRLKIMLADGVGGGLEWTHEWLPGQRFGNILLYRHDEARPLEDEWAARTPPAPRRRADAVAMLDEVRALDELWPGLVRARGRLERELASPDGGACRIAAVISAVVQEGERHRQLRRRAQDLRRSLRGALLRLGAGDDPDERAYWRQLLLAVLDHRLARAAQRGRLGLLIDTLGVSEGELEISLARTRGLPRDGAGIEAGETRSADVFARRPALAWAAPSPQADIGRCAEVALDLWAQSMYRAARSRRLAQDVGLSPHLIERLVDEIIAGAARLGLEQQLRLALERTVGNAASDNWERLGAAVAASVFSGFLERLAVGSEDLQAGRAPLSLGGARGAGLGLQHAATAAGDEAMPFAERWRLALARLVEDNIEAWRSAAAVHGDVELTAFLAPLPLDYAEPPL